MKTFLKTFALAVSLACALGVAATSPARALVEIDVNKGNIEPLPIAVTDFLSGDGMGAQISSIVAADLQRSGLFAPIDKGAFIEKISNTDAAPRFEDWKVINAQALVTGRVTQEADGRLRAEFRLWDTFAGQQLIGEQYFANKANTRRVAHIIADAIYERLTGEKGYFDTRIVFVAEAGSKDKRQKRLAIMDQDGAGVRYLSDGRAIAITPRFSPTRQEITYMSYESGQPKVYLLQIETGQRELVGDFPGMTFAPRFSPDGQRVIMSLLRDDGNSNIFAMDLRSRSTTRLTNTASIDTSPEQKRAYYVASVRSRLKLSAVVFPLALVAGQLISHSSEPVTSSLMLLSAGWSGFSLAWYAVANGRAAWIATYEIGPRIGATVLSVLLIAASAPVWSYPALLLGCTSLGLLSFHRREFGRLFPRTSGGEPLPQDEGRERARSTAFSVIGAAYGSSPLPIASLLHIASAGPFASTDRLYRYGLFTVSTLGNALQEWVLGGPESQHRSLHLTALRLHLALGILGGAGIAVLARPVGGLLFGAHVAPSVTVALAYGTAFFFLSLSTPLTRNLLIPARRTSVVLRSVVISGACGIALMTILGLLYGGTGVAYGAAAAEAINFVLLLWPALALVRDVSWIRSDEEPAAEA